MNNKKNENVVKTVSVKEFAKELELEIVYEGSGKIEVQSISVSRPGLQISGFYKFFDNKRIQVIGNAEYDFLKSLTAAKRKATIEELISKELPCLIFSRNLPVFDEIPEIAKKYECPIFRSSKVTILLINDIMVYQSELLAPTEIVHGVLMDVFGVGILIKGRSGIGKSEIALELVNRGHRLVADDSVILKYINDQVVGKSPEKIRYYMEIRGIGIINVQQMFGPGAVSPSKRVDIIAELSPWAEGDTYDRIGYEENYENILGVDKLKIVVPVSPGRNIPVILETAARNFRLKQAGFDASADLIASVFGKPESNK